MGSLGASTNIEVKYSTTPSLPIYTSIAGL